MKQTKPLQDRLAELAASARQEAAGLPEGKKREQLLKKVQQAETASEIEGWAKAPGLQPPK